MVGLPVPKEIREFSYPGCTNVFRLVPTNENLYPVALRAEWKNQFNDWNGRILLLAKDVCPTRVISDSVEREDAQPWRYSQRELGDEGGWRTNERLYYLASMIPGGKLYGSSTANMLYDDPGWSRSLPGFKKGPLHEFLKHVLSWAFECMPQMEAVACLGAEAWFLTCMTTGNQAAARGVKEYRDAHKPVTAALGKRKIIAFPLFHPAARVSNDLKEKGWRAFASSFDSGMKVARNVN